jgi:hypothetical protein
MSKSTVPDPPINFDELKKVVATNMNMDIETLNALLSKNKYNSCAAASSDTTTSDDTVSDSTSDTTSSADTTSTTNNLLNETINNCPINADNINKKIDNDNGKGCESVDDHSLHIRNITSTEGGKVVNIRILSL